MAGFLVLLSREMSFLIVFVLSQLGHVFEGEGEESLIPHLLPTPLTLSYPYPMGK